MFFFSSRRRHTRWTGDWSSDVCSSDLVIVDRKPGYPPRRQWAGRPDERPLNENLVIASASHPKRQSCSPASRPARESRRRSEERRVGKEGRCRWSPEHEKKRKHLDN